jgi:carbonic anhydrase/acetyltransferase-like protein (isoleucine patch superfamily)
MSSPHEFRPEQTHTSAFIAPGAIVVDDVTIGPQASVWYNAVLRGDCAPIRVGRGTNVQDGAVLHADPGFPCELGDGVTVGHGAIVHGAIVGNNTVIGMKSVIQNGAKIGENSIVAVGSVVTEGSEFPSGSLVMGVPARLKRQLEPHEIELNRYSAEHYVHNAEEFAQAGQTLRGTAE